MYLEDESEYGLLLFNFTGGRMTLVNAKGEILEVSHRRFIPPNPQSLVGLPIIGSRECVALVQRYLPEIGNTSTWLAGKRVVECRDSEIRIGTVIGTMVDGKWPGLRHNNHVGIYGGCNGRSISTGLMMSFILVEQYVAAGVAKIQAREIYRKGKSVNETYLDPSNNADAFFIIER